MRRIWPEALKAEVGYTLVETLVAMALFLSVLFPLGVSIGTLLLDREAENTRRALLIAQNEMTSAVLAPDLKNEQFIVSGGFVVRREVSRGGNTRDIQILISREKKPDEVLVRLHKTVVEAP